MKNAYKMPKLLLDELSKELSLDDHQELFSYGSSRWASFYKLRSMKETYFIKCGTTPVQKEILKSEYNNLRLLAQTHTVNIPELYCLIDIPGTTCIVMQFVETGVSNSKQLFEDAGRRLAQLHTHSSKAFGLDYNNYIGAIDQTNRPLIIKASEHYIQHRLSPLITMSIERGLLSSKEAKRFESLYPKLNEIIADEMPALIHGDLWSGNFIPSKKDGKAYFIDPASAYSIREMDLAMSLLFGGFPQCFYDAYHSTYPLEPGWRKRIPLFQMYYLLVHLLLFGMSYKQGVFDCLHPYE